MIMKKKKGEEKRRGKKGKKGKEKKKERKGEMEKRKRKREKANRYFKGTGSLLLKCFK